MSFAIIHDYELDELNCFEIAVLTALRSFGPTDSRFPSHKTLAKRAGMGITKVKEVLKALRDRGIVLWSSTLGSSNRYHVREGAGSPRGDQGGSRQATRGSSPHGDKEDVTNQRNEADHPRSPAASEEQEEPMRARSFDFSGVTDEPVQNSDRQERVRTNRARDARHRGLPPKGTHAWCVRHFENKAALVGHDGFNRGLLRKTITDLADGENKAVRPYSYEEIDAIIDVFFAKHMQNLRTEVRDVVLLFIHALPGVQKQTHFRDEPGPTKSNRTYADRMFRKSQASA